MIKIICSLFFLSLTFSVTASDKVMGSAFEFTSPGGIKEQCIILEHIPGGVYSDSDRQIEQSYCAMDIYADTAMCPKTWSTSPGTIFYPIKNSQYSSISQFENNHCKNQKHIPIKAIVFKNTMNMRDTSGTFSTASLLYYHFSRYLNAQIKVPVAVFRSIDKETHRKRVTRPGLSITRKGLIHNGWKDMLQIENNPSSYHPVNEVFTQDQKQIYGVLLRATGKRYSAEINGSRQSGWGEGQSRDFQQTYAFSALKSHKPLSQAVTKRRSNVTREQMVFWMRDLIEITLLDYIFSQQDRIGNIDYTRVWLFDNNGTMKLDAKGQHSAAVKSLQIKQTHLNDNDAAGRYSYANYTKKTSMLEKIRHYNSATYQQLMKLDKDFSQQGELYQYLAQTFGLSKKQRDMIVKNTTMAAEIIRTHCRSGKLIFDLEPEQFFLQGSVEPVHQSCEL